MDMETLFGKTLRVPEIHGCDTRQHRRILPNATELHTKSGYSGKFMLLFMYFNVYFTTIKTQGLNLYSATIT